MCCVALIFDATSIVKVTLRNTVRSMCDSLKRRDRTQPVFSAPNYLFVSTRVAKEFPDMLESAVILSYHNHLVSAEQSKLWSNGSMAHHRFVRQREVSWGVSALVSAVSTGFTVVLLVVGSQSQTFQTLVVGLLNPLLLGGVAFLGSSLFHSSLVGVPLAVGILLVIFGVVLWWSSRNDRHVSVNGTSSLGRSNVVAPLSFGGDRGEFRAFDNLNVRKQDPQAHDGPLLSLVQQEREMLLRNDAKDDANKSQSYDIDDDLITFSSDVEHVVAKSLDQNSQQEQDYCDFDYDESDDGSAADRQAVEFEFSVSDESDVLSPARSARHDNELHNVSVEYHFTSSEDSADAILSHTGSVECHFAHQFDESNDEASLHNSGDPVKGVAASVSLSLPSFESSV